MEMLTLTHGKQEIGAYEQDTFAGIVLGLLPEAAPSNVEHSDGTSIATKKAIYEKDGWQVIASTNTVAPQEGEEDTRVIYTLQITHPPKISAELFTTKVQEVYGSTSGKTVYNTTVLRLDPDGKRIAHPSHRGVRNEVKEETIRQGKPRQAASMRWLTDRTISQSRLHELTMRLGSLKLGPEHMLQPPEPREPSKPTLRIIK